MYEFITCFILLLIFLCYHRELLIIGGVNIRDQVEILETGVSIPLKSIEIGVYVIYSPSLKAQLDVKHLDNWESKVM